MKKYFLFSFYGCLLLASLFFAFAPKSFSATISNSGYYRDFGGKIITTVANEITTFQSSGYICSVPGQSISIIPIGSPAGTPMSFIIPFGIISRTGNPIRPGQYMLGKYGGMASAYCIPPSPHPVAISIPLQTIVYYGNSR